MTGPSNDPTAAGSDAASAAGSAAPATPAHLRTRSDGGRAVEYPPTPEPLAVGVYDNHTHLEIADGALPLDVHEHLERAASVGVVGAVQVGTDVATSRW